MRVVSEGKRICSPWIPRCVNTAVTLYRVLHRCQCARPLRRSAAPTFRLVLRIQQKIRLMLEPRHEDFPSTESRGRNPALIQMNISPCRIPGGAVGPCMRLACMCMGADVCVWFDTLCCGFVEGFKAFKHVRVFSGQPDSRRREASPRSFPPKPKPSGGSVNLPFENTS